MMVRNELSVVYFLFSIKRAFKRVLAWPDHVITELIPVWNETLNIFTTDGKNEKQIDLGFDEIYMPDCENSARTVTFLIMRQRLPVVALCSAVNTAEVASCGGSLTNCGELWDTNNSTWV